MQRINITLPANIVQQLSFSVPAGKRSQFIAEAVTEKLGKEKQQKKKLQESLAKNKKFYTQVAKEWETTEIEEWPII